MNSIFAFIYSDVPDFAVSLLANDHWEVSDLVRADTKVFSCKITPKNTALFGERIFEVKQNIVQTNVTEHQGEYNGRSYVYITYGPSVTDNFQDCFQIKLEHPEYLSGLYYISYQRHLADSLAYCDQETAGGGWTLFYANSNNPNITKKKSFLDLYNSRGNDNLADLKVYDYRDPQLVGMVNFDYLSLSHSMMGKDLGHMRSNEFGRISFANNDILKSFLGHSLIPGTTCTQIPDDIQFTYRNSNGMEYVFNQLHNDGNGGYGFGNCMSERPAETPGSHVENAPNHIFYNIRDSGADRVRAVFGEISDDEGIARYFLRPRYDLQPPIPVLTANVLYRATKLPITVTVTFSEQVYGFNESGIICTNCTVSKFVKAPSSDLMYYFEAYPKYLEHSGLNISVIAGACRDVDQIENVASDPLIYSVDGDYDIITVPIQPKNESCDVWLDVWKSKQASYLYGIFGVQASGSFRIGLSETKSKTHPMIILEFCTGESRKDHNIITTNAAGEEVIAYTNTYDFNITATDIKLLFFIYDNGKISVGVGNNITQPIVFQNTLTTSLNVQYASYSSSPLAVVTYLSPLIGPPDDSSELRLWLSSNATNPCYTPFEVTLTFSREILSVSRQKISANGHSDWLSHLNRISARGYTIVVTPNIESNLKITVTVQEGAARDVDGRANKETTIDINYSTDKLVATLTPVQPTDGYTTVPIQLTLTFNRDVIDMTSNKIKSYSDILIRRFRGNNKTYEFDLYPSTSYVSIYIGYYEVHDYNGQGNEYFYQRLELGAVKSYFILGNAANYPLWLLGWSSNTAGKIRASFDFRGENSLFIGISRSASKSDDMYEIGLGMISNTTQEYTGNRIVKYTGGVGTTEYYIEKEVFKQGNNTHAWILLENKVLKVGIDTDEGVDPIMTFTDSETVAVEYVSFTNNNDPVFVQNIEVGPSTADSPTVVLTTTAERPTHIIPVPVTVTFSEEVEDFTLDDLIVYNSFHSNLTQINTTSYEFELYPTRINYFTSVSLPAGAAYSKRTKYPTLSSNYLSAEVSDQIKEFDLDPMNGVFYLWYSQFYSLRNDYLWTKFRAKGKSSYYVSFANDIYRRFQQYIFLFDGPDHKVSISRLSNGNLTEVASGTKEIALDNEFIDIWARFYEGIVEMGVGTVLGEGTVLTYTDLQPLAVAYVSWSSGSEPVIYKDISVGEQTSELSVDIECDKSNPNSIPYYCTITFATPVESFNIYLLEQTGCTFDSELKEINRNSYAFQVMFSGEEGCEFYLPANVITDVSGSRNVESNPIYLAYTDSAFNFVDKIGLYEYYSFFYDQWKAKDSNEMHLQFELECTRDAYVLLSDGFSYTTAYEIVFGANNNQAINLLQIDYYYKTSLATVNIPVCAGSTRVPMWVKIEMKSSGKHISIGSGSTLGENEILYYADKDGETTKQQYVMFSSNRDPVAFYNIAVGPASGDITAPSGVFLTPYGKASTVIPVPVTLTFNEPVVGMEESALQTSNCIISGFSAITSSIYRFEITPLSDFDQVAHVKVPYGAVHDHAGNGNLETEDFTVSPGTYVFDFYLPPYQMYYYRWFYQQWKSVKQGEISVDLSAMGEGPLYIGFFVHANAYPMYEFVFDEYGDTYICIVDTDDYTVLNKISNTDFLQTWRYSHLTVSVANGVFKMYADNVEILSYTALDEVWKLLQYVSYTSGFYDCSLRSIIISPNSATDARPVPSLSISATQPIQNVPIEVTLDFNIPVTGLYDTSYLRTDSGQVLFLNPVGNKFTFYFLPNYSNVTAKVEILEGAAKSAKNISSTAASIEIKVSDNILTYLALPLYNSVGFKNAAWSSSYYGNVYIIFDVFCLNDITIVLTEYLANAYPQYIITMGGLENTRTEIQRVQSSGISTVERLGQKPMCHEFRNVSYWIELNNGLISIGSGRVLHQNLIYNYTDNYPLACRFVSLSAWDNPNLYTNIVTGPINNDAIEGIIYTEEETLTNKESIECYVYWSQDVTGFDSNDIVSTGASIINFVAVSKKWYKFTAIPSVCGITEIYIPAGAVVGPNGKGNDETLPLYLEWCNQSPLPVMYVTQFPTVDYIPIPVFISFKSEVFGFTSEDLTIQGFARVDLLKRFTQDFYRILVTPLDSNSVTLQIKENQLNDIYGNNNLASIVYEMPKLGPVISTFNANQSYYDDTIILEQWSSGENEISTLVFEALCEADIVVSFSSQKYLDSNSYVIIGGSYQNKHSQIQIGNEIVNSTEGRVCFGHRYTKFWASFNKRVVSFGRGGVVGERTIITFTDTQDRGNKLVGLGNYDTPILYRDIVVGPPEYVPPKVEILTSLTHYYTNQNPIYMNITFSKNVTSLSTTKFNITGGGSISAFEKVSDSYYTFQFIPKDGLNTIMLPADSVTETASTGRGNIASGNIVFEYYENALYGSFSVDVDEVTELPIATKLYWSLEVFGFSTDAITSNTGGFFGEATSTDNRNYQFDSFLPNMITPKISIPEGKVLSQTGEGNKEVKIFEMPGYPSDLGVYNAPKNLLGKPFTIQAWRNIAHNNLEVTFEVECTKSAGVGFTPYAGETENLYEIEFGTAENTQSVIRRGRNQKVVATSAGAICETGRVPLWIKIRGGEISVGKGTVVSANTIMTYVDEDPYNVEYAYFTSYTDAVKYTAIKVGPTGLVRPTISVKSVISGDGYAEAGVTLSDSGDLYCLARLNPSRIPSTYAIKRYGTKATAVGLTSVRILDLAPGATYDVWCYGESSDGVGIDEENIFENVKSVIVRGKSFYPVFKVYYIAGLEHSLKISASMDMLGTLYAYAVPHGSAVPSKSDLINRGMSYIIGQTDTVFELSYSRILDYNTYYDVYFYAVSLSGLEDPESMILSSARLVVTDATCEEVNGMICGNHGICKDGYCECDAGYHGYNCFVQCPGYVNGKDCNGNGVCNGYTGQCVCNNFYRGESCSLICPNDGRRECSGHGYCRAANSTATCQCVDPWYGDDCSLEPKSSKTTLTLTIVFSTLGVFIVFGLGLVGYHFYTKPKIPEGVTSKKSKKQGDLDAESWLYSQMA